LNLWPGWVVSVVRSTDNAEHFMSGPKESEFWSCGQEKMVYFAASSVVGCCGNLKTNRTPHVGSYGQGGVIDIDELANAKRSHLAAVRRGEIPEACRECPSWQLHDRSGDTPYLFDDVVIGHHTACNTDCYYCLTNSNSAPVPVPARAAAKLLPTLKEMVALGYIDPNAIIRFSGGEPTILPEFEKLMDYFIEVGRQFFINTSGVRYSPAIERMLRRGDATDRVVISIDSASRQTYEVIKGFDLAERVWSNIARYANIGPDMMEVKYIVLPENAHETGDFVRKCHDIGVRRVSVDLDSRPVIYGISNALTDEMIEGIAVLIYQAKQRGLSVYYSGSGNALWQEEHGERRVQAALARLSAGRFTMARLADGFLGFAKIPQDLAAGVTVDWGRCENVTATPLNSDSRAIYLQEDASLSVHRIEQVGVPVTANDPYTLDVIARPRGRNRLMIEFRDMQSVAYTRATFDLERAQVEACVDEDAVAVGSVDDEWVRCQLTLVPTSNFAVFNVTLVNQQGAHVYEGRDQAGVDIRPPVVGRDPLHASAR
jgi:pyruvate-formate lyase-activating enzyme